jgi:hypothetical protein
MECGRDGLQYWSQQWNRWVDISSCTNQINTSSLLTSALGRFSRMIVSGKGCTGACLRLAAERWIEMFQFGLSACRWLCWAVLKPATAEVMRAWPTMAVGARKWCRHFQVWVS